VAPVVVVVAQAFKESLATREVADAVAEGVRRAGAVPRVVLGSDGGDGLLDALAPARRRDSSPAGRIHGSITSRPTLRVILSSRIRRTKLSVTP